MGLFDHLFNKSKSPPSEESSVEPGTKPAEPAKHSDAAARGAAAPPKADPSAFLHPKSFVPRGVTPLAAPVKSGAISGVRKPGAQPAPPPAEEIVLALGDVLSRIPTPYLKLGQHDPKRELRFSINDLSSDIARGRASVPLSRIAQLVPDIFVKQISRDEDTEIRLPLQKLVEQIGLLRSRPNAEKGGRTVTLASPAQEPKAQYPMLVKDTAEPGRETLHDLTSVVEPVFELKPVENSALNRPVTPEPFVDLKPSFEPIIVQFPVAAEPPVILAPPGLVGEGATSPAPEVAERVADPVKEVAAPPKHDETPERVGEPAPAAGSADIFRVLADPPSMPAEILPAIPAEPAVVASQSPIPPAGLPVASSEHAFEASRSGILPLAEGGPSMPHDEPIAEAGRSGFLPLPAGDPGMPHGEPIAAVTESVPPSGAPVASIAENVAPRIEPAAAVSEPMVPRPESAAVADRVAMENEAAIAGPALAASRVDPVASIAEPATPQGGEAASTAEPIAPRVEPVVSRAEPVSLMAELAALIAEPVVSRVPSAQPAAVHGEPAVSAQEAAAPRAESPAPISESIAPGAQAVAPPAEPMTPRAESPVSISEPPALLLEPAVPVAESDASRAGLATSLAEAGTARFEPIGSIAEGVAPLLEPIVTRTVSALPRVPTVSLAESVIAPAKSEPGVVLTEPILPPGETGLADTVAPPARVESILPAVPPLAAALEAIVPGREPVPASGQTGEVIDKLALTRNEPTVVSGEQFLPPGQIPAQERPQIAKPVIRESSEAAEVGGEKIQLSLAALLRNCPMEIIVGERPTVPDSIRITLPFAPIDRQLSTGHVEISAVRFVAAIPFSYQKHFTARMGVKVPIPLEEVFQNLPSQAAEEPAASGPPPQILAPAVPEEVEVLPIGTTPASPTRMETHPIETGSSILKGSVLPSAGGREEASLAESFAGKNIPPVPAAPAPLHPTHVPPVAEEPPHPANVLPVSAAEELSHPANILPVPVAEDALHSAHVPPVPAAEEPPHPMNLPQISTAQEPPHPVTVPPISTGAQPPLEPAKSEAKEPEAAPPGSVLAILLQVDDAQPADEKPLPAPAIDPTQGSAPVDHSSPMTESAATPATPAPLDLPAFHQFVPPPPVIVAEHVEAAAATQALSPEPSSAPDAMHAATAAAPVMPPDLILEPASPLPLEPTHVESVSAGASEAAVPAHTVAPVAIEPEHQDSVLAPEPHAPESTPAAAAFTSAAPAPEPVAAPVVIAPPPVAETPSVVAQEAPVDVVEETVTPSQIDSVVTGSASKEETAVPAAPLPPSSVSEEGTHTIRPPQMIRPMIVLPPPIIGFTPAPNSQESREVESAQSKADASDSTKEASKLSAPVSGSSTITESLVPASEAGTSSAPVEAVIPDEGRKEKTGLINIDFAQALAAAEPARAVEIPALGLAGGTPPTPPAPAREDGPVSESAAVIEAPGPVSAEKSAPVAEPVPPMAQEAVAAPAAGKPTEKPTAGITFVAQGHFAEHPAAEPVVTAPSEPIAETVMPPAAESIAAHAGEAVSASVAAPVPEPPAAAVSEPVAPPVADVVAESPAEHPADTTTASPVAPDAPELEPLLHLPKLISEFTPADVLPPPALPFRRFDQDALQALFMTDEPLDLAKVSRLAAQLPGVHACVIATRDQACTGGALPEGFDLAALLGLAPRVGEAAGRMPIGDLKHFTLYGERYSVSFFARNGLSLCAVHRPRSFVPGVREKLVAIADELSK